MLENVTSPRQLFPNAKFWPPASEALIASVEKELGVRLPDQLRRLYLDCDGFREGRGNTKYLVSLTDDDGSGSLVSATRFWWNEWPEYQPTLDLRPFLFFGMNTGGNWGINWRTGDAVIAYDHRMLDEYEVAGTDILEVWRRDYALYDEI
jgi:hypothetical protein